MPARSHGSQSWAGYRLRWKLKRIGIQELVRRRYLPAAETPQQRALSTIAESRLLVATSRAELEYLRASACSIRERVAKSSTLLPTARSDAVRIASRQWAVQ